MPKVTIRGKEVTTKEARGMFREAVKQATPEIVLDELLKELKQFEQKFSMSTVEFYHQYRAGKMGDSRDVMRWAAFYESYMNVVKNLMSKPAKLSRESEKVKGRRNYSANRHENCVGGSEGWDAFPSIMFVSLS